MLVIFCRHFHSLCRNIYMVFLYLLSQFDCQTSQDEREHMLGSTNNDLFKTAMKNNTMESVTHVSLKLK